MKHIEIIIGSQMGSAEYVAEQLSEQLISDGFKCTLHEQPDLTQCHEHTWLLVTSTYGAGDYPENLLPFIEQLNNAESLSHIKFGVVGLGDSSYDTYNLAAHNGAKLLTEKGASAALATLTIDVLDEALPEDTALEWLPNYQKAILAS